MRIGQIIPITEAEGPGKRFALWFQGCTLRCPGCCNPEMLSFKGGNEISLDEVTTKLKEVNVEGISLLGGEPTAHMLDAISIASVAKGLGLSVMVYSGYKLEQILEMENGKKLLGLVDILVDGPYIRELPEKKRRWIGSTNQEIHFLSDFYKDGPEWYLPNTLEIRLDKRKLTINGFPAINAIGLWKRISLI